MDTLRFTFTYATSTVLQVLEQTNSSKKYPAVKVDFFVGAHIHPFIISVDVKC